MRRRDSNWKYGFSLYIVLGTVYQWYLVDLGGLELTVAQVPVFYGVVGRGFCEGHL